MNNLPHLDKSKKSTVEYYTNIIMSSANITCKISNIINGNSEKIFK